MRKHTFKVKRDRNATVAHDFKVDVPTSLAEVDLIAARFGTGERLAQDAVAQWVVNVQNNGLRKMVPADREMTAEERAEAQSFVEGYISGSAKAAAPTVISAEEAKEAGLSKKQLALLEAKGVIIR